MLSADELLRLLHEIRVLPRRMLLETPGVAAAAPMLRGVWGAALYELDSEAYQTVFAPQANGLGEAPSLYVLRPAPPDPAFAPAVEWISLGAALRFDRVLQRAWDIASGMGLGPNRRRFHVRRVLCLSPDGKPGEHAPASAILECGDSSPLWSMQESLPRGSSCEPLARIGQGQSGTEVPRSKGGDSSPLSPRDRFAPEGWALSAAAWPLDDPAATPCRLVFPAPLRLRRHGRLIEEPALADLIVAATRRIGAYLPAECREAWQQISREAMEAARNTPAGPWRGTRLDLHRYSAPQESELDLHGVAGSLELPRGPGELWPLLAAAQWLHLGKGTIMGLGQLIVEMPDDERQTAHP